MVEIGTLVVSFVPLAKKIEVRVMVMVLSILNISDFKEKVLAVSQPGIVSYPVYGAWLSSQRTLAFQQTVETRQLNTN